MTTHKNSAKTIMRKIGIMMASALVCIAAPLIIKGLILNPTIPLIFQNEEISKGIVALLTGVIILVTYYLFYKKVEKRSIGELSIKKLPKSTVLGFMIGFCIISLLVIILILLGNYSITSANHLRVVLKPLILFIVMGIWEEVIFRGILFSTIDSILGTVNALIISSAIFSLVHFANSGFNIVSGLAVALHLGLMTGLIFALTQNLWYPIFLHIGWNFSFVFFGITVSGVDEFDTYLVGDLVGPAMITGGEFGPENSIITIALGVMINVMLYRSLKKQERLTA